MAGNLDLMQHIARLRQRQDRDNNIDLAPRLASLVVGDTVQFAGEYVWNEQGGVVHRTHHDPDGRHPTGHLTAHGRTVE